MRLREGRFDAATEAYERVLSLDGAEPGGQEGPAGSGRRRGRRPRPPGRSRATRSRACVSPPSRSSQQQFDPQEGFVLSRINGQWDVQSILKLCPMPEDDTLFIFSRLLDRQVIELR